MSTTQVQDAGAVRRVHALDSDQIAWLAALPCALLTLLVVALLGPPLGHAFFEPGAATFWPGVPRRVEPVEHSRYVLALLGPAALAAAVLLGARRAPHARDRAVRVAVPGAQLALLAFVALCVLAQNDVLLDVTDRRWQQARYFTVPTLAFAVLAAALAPLLLRRRRLAAAVASLVRETPARRLGALALAGLFTALWLLTAVTTDASIAVTNVDVGIHVLWSLAEPFAILDGRTPLVDFHAQYGQLIPYGAAAAMALFGATLGVYTIAMATASGLALLAVYALLRRVVRSSLLALALYAPFVATGFFMKSGPPDDRFGPANLFPLWPIRYGGPYVLAWLLVRHVDGAAPRRPWPLFLAAGLVLLNNPDFGLPALAALAVALALARPPRSRRALGRLLAEAAGGLLAATALVALLTLVRSGSLPRFGAALEFSRLYGVDGWALLPMPTGLGVHLVVYLTFAAAIAAAAVRRARREPGTALTAALAWSGTFGLCAGTYFAGRSHPSVLIDLFSPWALALVLLTVVAARALAARGWRRPAPAELAVLVGFGLLVCSLAQTPAPWAQLARIGERGPAPVFEQRDAAAFVAQRTRPHEPVAILIPLGHRIAYDTGRVNVSPYASMESMPTRQQLDRTIAALRDAGGDKLFVSTYFTVGAALAAMQRSGFEVADQAEVGGTTIIELVDRRR
ncbi:MAG TPA: hypothetical protein VF250_08615 [Conexibacter sp.]